MLKELIEEYQKELDKVNNRISWEEFEEQNKIKKDGVWVKNFDNNYYNYEKQYPRPNKAKLKRLGIMIRQKMVELENGLNVY